MSSKLDRRKKHEEKRFTGRVSVNLEKEKHIADWFNRNKGQASVLIKQWIEKEIENEKDKSKLG